MKNFAKIALAGMFAAASFSVQAVDIAEINEIWAMGSALESGWSMGQASLQKVSDGVFEGQVILLDGELKFNYERDNWDAWIYATAEGASLQIGTPQKITIENPGGDYKFISSVKGGYKLIVNLNDNTLTVTEATEIYLIGDATPGGWNLGEAKPMQRIAEQTYEGSALLGTGDFKFLASNKNFASSIVSPEATGMVLDIPMTACYVDDNKWKCNEAGAYTFTVVLGDNPTLTVKESKAAFIPTSVALIGTAINTSALNVSSGVFKYCGDVKEGNYVISATDGSVTKYAKLAGDDTITFVDTEAEATAIDVVADGQYQIVVNALMGQFAQTQYIPWENLYVTGNFNVWSFDPFTKVAENEFKWDADILVDEGEVELKFMGVNNFDTPEMGLHPYVANELLADAQYCYNGGNDNKWKVTESAHYTITVNTLMQTVSVEVSEVINNVKDINAVADVKIAAVNGEINITVANPTAIAVYDLSGRTLAKVYGKSLNVRAPKGVSIVKAGDTVKKVIL